MGKKLDETEVLERFHKVHGDNFDYSEFHYVNKRTKGCIICHKKDENGVEHGEFWMLPKNHWEGQGCPKCALEMLKKDPPRRKSFDKFIEDLKAVHGDKYTVLSDEYINTHTKIKLHCNVCGADFEAIPCDLLHGHGCRNCFINAHKAKYLVSYDEMVERFNKIHKGKYSYGKNDKDKLYAPNDEIIITCPEHGDFVKTVYRHRVNGCYKCGMKAFSMGKLRPVEDFRREFEEKVGDKISFNDSDFVNMNAKIKFHCNVCGHDFMRKPTSFLYFSKCPECNKKILSALKTKTTEQFKVEITEKYNGFYILDKTVYTKNNEPCIITCPEHGDFITTPNVILRGYGCPKHYNNKSKQELSLTNFISELIGKENGTPSDRSLLDGNELDYYSNVYNVAIEYDGLFWHSDNFKNSDYHLKKTQACAELGVKLFHVFEDEWLTKQDIVKNIFKRFFNKIENVIDVNDCEIRAITLDDSKNFLNENHIKGECKTNENPRIAFGMFCDDDLVSIAVLSKLEEYKYKLIRYSTKLDLTINNAFETMLQYIKKHLDIDELHLSLDKRYPLNIDLMDLGFELINETEPMRYNVVFNLRCDDEELSQIQLSKKAVVRQIYDCGQEEYVLKFNKTKL